HWQRNWLQGEVLDQQLGYWTKQLASLPVAHSLPLDHPRPSIQTFVGTTYNSQIDVATSKKLNHLCQSQGATLFMGLHAAFSVLLSRYSSEKDIVVGSPIANREQAEVAGLIGFFVNTLVLRSDLSENPSFTSLLKQSKTMLLDAYAHQQVPFEQIVERLQPERSLSHSPLFQIMLVLQNNEQGILELPGLTLSPVEQRSVGIAKYDLTLNISENEQGLWLGWEYNIDLLEASTIARMANHFGLLLNDLVKAPNENVFKAEMLSAQERQQLLIDWNNTYTDYPNHKCIHELFETQVQNNAGAVAVVFEDQQLTYEQLNQKSNQLAHYLISERQVAPDTLVGICVERSLEMVVGMLAILKAGGAYVPLDPEYPEARLKYMLDDAKLTTVLTQSHLRETTPVTDQQAVCLDSEETEQQLQIQSTQNLNTNELGLTSAHLAYVIYTSGSTGTPKGVMIEHKGLVNTVTDNAHQFMVTSETIFLQSISLNFDAASWVIWMALARRAQLVIANEAVRLGDNVEAYINQARVTHLMMTPSSLAVLDPGNLTGLDVVIVGGEACHHGLVNRWQSGVVFYNAYGPTETSICSTMEKATPKGLSGIGKPIKNIQIYILNEQQNLSPQGIAGELHIGGIGLARGYLNRPDLTAEKFIVNPFYDKKNPASSERLYKTGDLVRWLPDGNLEFVGRIDHQVKIRGFRIELGEIENTLGKHESVKDVIVLARESVVKNDNRLVAYVVTDAIDLSEKSEISVTKRNEYIDSLRHHLSQALPDYMVPSAFVLLDQLPLTPNGKVERDKLPEPDISLQQHIYVAPRIETEKLLCEIWQDILGIERVGITDDFFQLGGHSLLATRLVARINRTLNISLPLQKLFLLRTVELLANELDVNNKLSGILLDSESALSADEIEVVI
ncbi:MAG: amino acid adenylation domain-containing protein, partial [Pseudomonadota bacterium]